MLCSWLSLVVVSNRDQDGHSPDEAERVLLEEVRESIDDLVQLIQVYKSKGRIVRVITSSLFKRRQEELEATINMAINRLQARNTDARGVAVGVQIDDVECRGVGPPMMCSCTYPPTFIDEIDFQLELPCHSY